MHTAEEEEKKATLHVGIDLKIHTISAAIVKDDESVEMLKWRDNVHQMPAVAIYDTDINNPRVGF